jgi:hypothetical protein
VVDAPILDFHDYLALLFASAAVAGGIILTYATQPQGFVNSATFAFGRSLFHELINLYAVKMASVFMISTSVIGVRTRFTPRWSAYLACIAHKSSEICERCRLRQQNPPATPDNSAAFWEEEFKNRLFRITNLKNRLLGRRPASV